MTDGEVPVGRGPPFVVVQADDGAGEEGAQAMTHVPGAVGGGAPAGGARSVGSRTQVQAGAPVRSAEEKCRGVSRLVGRCGSMAFGPSAGLTAVFW